MTRIEAITCNYVFYPIISRFCKLINSTPKILSQYLYALSLILVIPSISQVTGGNKILVVIGFIAIAILICYLALYPNVLYVSSSTWRVALWFLITSNIYWLYQGWARPFSLIMWSLQLFGDYALALEAERSTKADTAL